MAYDAVNYESVEPVAPGMHFLRDALDADNLGVTVLDAVGLAPLDQRALARSAREDAEAGWKGKEHDHAGDGQEEVSVLLEGAATVTVEGEAVDLDAGDALRIDAEDSREIEVHEDSQWVLVGAP